MSSRQQMFPNASEERSKRLRIGDAAKLLGLEPYVLRYWESEFPQLAPLRTKKGQRLYSEQDLALIRTIQTLLYEEGLTIEGAKRRLEDTAQFRKMTRGIAQELQSIRDLLTIPCRRAPCRKYPAEEEQ
jgi:DNA-binding transcriptional MerR regulator